MHIRFVTREIDPDSHRRTGVFQVVYRLLDAPGIPDADRQRLRDELDWFRKHLAAPDRVTRTRRPDAPGKAISWFKPTAHEHIRRMRSMCALLQEHGIAIDVLKAKRVGFVVYEDDHQVVAEPFTDLPT